MPNKNSEYWTTLRVPKTTAQLLRTAAALTGQKIETMVNAALLAYARSQMTKMQRTFKSQMDIVKGVDHENDMG
jgi:hypothetical protein